MTPISGADMGSAEEMFAHEFFDLALSDSRVGMLCEVIEMLVERLGGVEHAPELARPAIHQALAANDVLAVQQIQWFPRAMELRP